MPALTCEKHGPFGPATFCCACTRATVEAGRDHLKVENAQLRDLIASAQAGIEQTHSAIFDAAYSLIDLERRKGPVIAYAAAAPIESAYEVTESEEQKALYEALYRATHPHPFPDIWETRKAEITKILAVYGTKRVPA